jgi:4-hydroxybenzoyl-CoA thioesterase
MTALPFASNRLAIEVEWGQCDPARIVWNPRFFELFDNGTWMLFQKVIGVPRQNLAKHLGIFSFPLVEAGASFHAPLRFGDSAELISTVTEFKRSSFFLSHRILKDGKLCVDGKETRVWAGTHPDDPERMRAIPIPNDLIERFRATAQ